MNSGGFLAIGQYTSHMTGLLASISDNLVIGAIRPVIGAATALLLFCGGAAFAAFFINYLRSRLWGRQFAGPVLIEAVLILLFGAIGTTSFAGSLSPYLVFGLLCFMMGLQNATITKITRARMRTTHVTGIVTDIGIQLGNREKKINHHLLSLPVLRLVLVMFFAGGLAGAFMFSAVGFVFCVPLALMLAIVAAPPFFRQRSQVSHE